MRLVAVVVLLWGVLQLRCSDEGYSFGEYGARADRLEPSVTAFCLRATECVPRMYWDVDFCRVDLLTTIMQTDESCELALLDFFECGADASCIDFPSFWNGMEPGGCVEETEAVRACQEEPGANGGDP